MSTLDALTQIDTEDAHKQPFGQYEEEAIVALAIDHPEFFSGVSRFLKPELFGRNECKYLMAHILNYSEEFNIIPTREILRDIVLKDLTENDAYDQVLRIVDKSSNPREIPIIKDQLLKWARKRAFGMIYSEEAMAAYYAGQFDKLEAIVQEANRIEDIGDKGFWFFENLEILFKEDAIEHRTTGFPKLDRLLNNGGPSPKEVICWLAATNVGKCSTIDTQIYIKKWSTVYDIEIENGQIVSIPGFVKVQTARGMVSVCDLSEGDDIIEIPTCWIRPNEMSSV